MDFLLCYEGINREVENLSLVKYELQKRGYSCDIMRFNGPQYYHYSKRKCRATVVATPWLRYDVDVFPFLKLAKKPYKIVNLQWEQVYNKRGLESGLCSISGQSLNAHHFCWGKNSVERLEKCGVPIEKISVTGAIQMDYNREIFSSYYKTRDEIAKEYQLDNKQPWILFVSSFAYTKYTDEDAKKTEDKYGSFYADYIKLHKESQKAVLEWIDQYLEKYDCEFIYRPHPSESVDASEELCNLVRKYSNFHVISDGSVKQWAKVVNKVNLWISTSNAEIASMGVNYSIVRPIEIPDEFEVESMKNEELLETYEKFECFNISTGNDSIELNKKIQRLDKYYSYDSEKPAFVRMADELEKLLLGNEVQCYRFNFKQLISYSAIVKKWRILGAIMMFEERNPERRFIEKSYLKPIIKTNLMKLIDGHKKALKIEETVFKYLDSQLP